MRTQARKAQAALVGVLTFRWGHKMRQVGSPPSLSAARSAQFLALAYLARCVLWHPNMANVQHLRLRYLRNRAVERAFVGKHGEAAKIYERILKEIPFDGHIALRIGELRRKSGDL